MLAALESGGNPSSVHAEGRAARHTVEEARAQVAALVGAKPAEIVFTSGGSEANALALRGAVLAHAVNRYFVVATAHDSILATADDLAGEPDGPSVSRVPVDRNGWIDLAVLDSLLAGVNGHAVIAVMAANNETGVLSPLPEIVGVARAHGAIVHCDAAQAAGRMAIDFSSLGVDLMTVSAHKFGGPVGVGALVVREGLSLSRQIAGGGQELGRRAGTENVAAIAGFGAAASVSRADPDRWGRVSDLRDSLERAVVAAVPDAVIYGAEVARLPNTTMLGLPGTAGETQVMAMDLAGIAVSSGAACSSGKVGKSHVLAAMGAGDGASDAIRISLGPTTRAADIDAFLEAWVPFARRALARRRIAVAA
jgi:cysteine desulfurase